MAAELEVQAEDGTLSGRRKAATLLLALEPDQAALLMRRMTEQEVQAISEEMSRMRDITGEQIEQVLAEFKGGGAAVNVEPMLESMLEKALGADKARMLLDRIRRRRRDLEPFRHLRRLTPGQLEMVLKGEHPQVLALVVSYMEAQSALELLKSLEDELRYDVIRRMAMTVEMPFEMVRQVDVILEARALEVATQASFASDKNRFQTIAQMLNLAEPSISKAILDKLGKDEPDAAQEIQNLMFVFEDLASIPDREMQKVLGEIDKGDLVLAMKTASQEVKDKLLNNMSKRARESLLEEMEILGPKPLSEVEEAQTRIIDVVRALEERGEIVVARAGGEEMV